MSDMAISMAFLLRCPYADRSPVSATRSPIVIVPDNPVEAGVVGVDGVIGVVGVISDGAAAYIATSPISRPTMKVAIAIFEDFLPSDIEIP